jgi:AAA ATPase domain
LNVVIGENNSGKSSILRGLHLLQQGQENYGDVRIGAQQAFVEMSVSDPITVPTWAFAHDSPRVNLTITLTSTDRRKGSLNPVLQVARGQHLEFPRLPNEEPNHFIVPILSKRKTASYSEDIREEFVTSISSDMSNLAAKLSRIANPQHPGYEQYSNACKEILGFVVTHISSENGMLPGIILSSGERLSVTQLGEGVPNIVHLLANLAISKGKLFLIEEPENDLHPNALKALLNLIVSSSESNQFVISTHSNIVVRHLCAEEDSSLIQISSQKDQLPAIASVAQVPKTAEARIAVLHELGYAFSDFDLWDGWLILEESSAETIIRNYLIPEFTPSLRNVKTVSAGGIDNVEPYFFDFQRLMLFTHLQPAYVNRTWVRVDGDEVGKDMVEKLQKNFPTWKPEKFGMFTKPAFEHYYPAKFRDQAETALQILDKKARREAKKQLLQKVIAWLDDNPVRGKEALAESAQPVIQNLQQIQTEFQALKKRVPPES